jgi:hypothetical protein
LLWSPDGRHLALTGAENPKTDWKLLIVEAGTGKIAYRGQIEIGREGQWLLPEDSQDLAWGLAFFPPRTNAVEACARPP